MCSIKINLYHAINVDTLATDPGIVLVTQSFINVISLNYSDDNKNCEDDNDGVSMNTLNISVNVFDV